MSFLFGGGGGGDSSGAQMQADEARKQALRDKIDRLYGIGVAKTAPTVAPGTGFLPAKVINAVASNTPQFTAAEDPVAAAARAQIEAEDKQLGDATGSFYTDQLNRTYTKAARELRFRLARQGLLGGSAQNDLGGELSTDKNLGATRVADAVKQAVAGLDTEREQQRLNAINLVNSGAGESAVTAASTGLQNALNNAQASQKVNLFGDLFTSAADNVAGSNNAATAAALANRYYNKLGTFFPTSKGTTKVYATG